METVHLSFNKSKKKFAKETARSQSPWNRNLVWMPRSTKTESGNVNRATMKQDRITQLQLVCVRRKSNFLYLHAVLVQRRRRIRSELLLHDPFFSCNLKFAEDQKKNFWCKEEIYCNQDVFSRHCSGMCCQQNWMKQIFCVTGFQT